MMKAVTLKKPLNHKHDTDLDQSLQASRILKANPISVTGYEDLIEIKRARTKSLYDMSRMFFYLGLSVSLFLAVIAINWKTYDDQELIDLGSLSVDFEELLEVPVSVQPPPPPPKPNQQVVIVEVEDDVVIEELDIDLDVEMTEETQIEDHNIDFTMIPEEEEQIDEVFTIVENWPVPKGGMSTFYEYIADNINYPPMARRLNISGVVFVQFVVEKSGEITDVKVVKGIGAGCDEEAMRVVSSAPSWNPGKQRGMPVRVLMTVPIRFVLEGN